jgi:chlorophyll synthase
VVCGAAASGNYVWNDPKDIAQLLTCCMMSGPFLTGYTQTINDYYDREIDAINEPYRPIPSGNLRFWLVFGRFIVYLGCVAGA